MPRLRPRKTLRKRIVAACFDITIWALVGGIFFTVLSLI